jgi:hypothetical protein
MYNDCSNSNPSSQGSFLLALILYIYVPSCIVTNTIANNGGLSIYPSNAIIHLHCFRLSLPIYHNRNQNPLKRIPDLFAIPVLQLCPRQRFMQMLFLKFLGLVLLMFLSMCLCNSSDNTVLCLACFQF